MFTTTYPTATEVNQAMGRVYAYMGLAVFASMFVSWFVGSDPTLVQYFFTGITKWIVMFAPLAAVFLVVPAISAEPPKSIALMLLVGFASLMGLSLAVVFAVYTSMSIVSAFMGAAVLFSVMSIYGYFTRTDLSHIGQMATVALIAIIIASIINIFIGSTLMQMIISAIAIVIFLALTAYDTQTIREMVSEGNSSNSVEVLGALTLYLDFINLFINLLSIFGIKNDD
jgi:FtsH-binding integral membrane protein